MSGAFVTWCPTWAMKTNSEYTNELTMAKEDAKENLE